MKNTKKFFLILLLLIVQYNFPQSGRQLSNSFIRNPESGIQNPATLYPDSNIQYPETSIKHPDYRNHINIPAYDPSLMPLKTVRSETGVWTELNPKVPRVDYLGIHFINKDTGWACGANGVVIKTTNGGISWTISQTPTTTLLLKIHSYDGQVVIAIGYDGIIVRSSDGGNNFTQIISGVAAGVDLWGLKMLNDTLGWVSGMNATLLKTTDAGLSWQAVTPGISQHYWSLDFLNEQYGMIACGGGIVLKTTNGGSIWTQTQAGDTRSLYTIDIIDSLHIATAGGSYGKNVYSSNGGITWIQNTDLIFENGVNCISFINADTGYAVGENWAIRKTENRGVTWWASDPLYTEWWLNLLPNGVGYAAGTALKLYKTSNGYDNWEMLFLNDNFYDVYFLTEKTGFIVSDSLYKTTDGGITWKKKDNTPGGYDILFLDSLIGFIGGSQTMYKTIDGGNTWYQPNGIPGGISKIFFINNMTGWSIHGRSILNTADGGENWFTQITLPADNYTNIYFVDSLNGWATSRYIWQTTNGGTNWIQRTDVQLYFNRNIYFTSIDTGFVTVDMTNTGSHDLYKTTNGGISWLRESRIETSYNIHTFPNKYHWISNGWSMGQVFETTDNGNSWEEISGELPAIFGQFHSPIEYIGFAVSGYGLILKYFDTTYVPIELTQLTARYSLNKIELNWSTASELNNKGFFVEKSLNKIEWNILGFVPGNGTSTINNHYTFSDYDINGLKIYYRLKQIDYDGSENLSNEIEVIIGLDKDLFELFTNYPNPFNPCTKISWQSPISNWQTLKVYDVLGNEIATLVDEYKPAGSYEVSFDPSGLASGIYFYTLQSDEFAQTKKMVLVR